MGVGVEIVALTDVVIVAVGTIIAPVPDGITRVATIVAWVCGAALGIPKHMPYALATAWSIKSLLVPAGIQEGFFGYLPDASDPRQAFRLLSAMTHWTPPSPTVNPDFPVCLQRHSSEGAVPQMSASKLADMND